MTFCRRTVFVVWAVALLASLEVRAATQDHSKSARHAKATKVTKQDAPEPAPPDATKPVTKPTRKSEELSRSLSFDEQLLGARDIHYQAQFVPGVPWRTMLLTQPAYRFRAQARLGQASVR